MKRIRKVSETLVSDTFWDRVSQNPLKKQPTIRRAIYGIIRTREAKGQEKAGAETAMAYLSYDMRRAMNLLGVAALIAHFQGIAMQKHRG